MMCEEKKKDKRGVGRPREYDREKGERKHRSIFCTKEEQNTLREVLKYLRSGETDKTLNYIVVNRPLDEKAAEFSGYMSAIKELGSEWKSKKSKKNKKIAEEEE